MNDRFLYRAICNDGKFHHGYLARLYKDEGYGKKGDFCISNSSFCPYAYLVTRPETIGQCTGLKDKNGKLVYEGDIVKLHGCEFMWEVKYDIDCGQFIYERQSPETFPPSKLKPSYIADDFSGCLVCWTEVKGNIYENPDLLNNPENFNTSAENVKGGH